MDNERLKQNGEALAASLIKMYIEAGNDLNMNVEDLVRDLELCLGFITDLELMASAMKPLSFITDNPDDYKIDTATREKVDRLQERLNHECNILEALNELENTSKLLNNFSSAEKPIYIKRHATERPSGNFVFSELSFEQLRNYLSVVYFRNDLNSVKELLELA